jgi:hypothetical protein
MTVTGSKSGFRNCEQLYCLRHQPDGRYEPMRDTTFGIFLHPWADVVSFDQLLYQSCNW